MVPGGLKPLFVRTVLSLARSGPFAVCVLLPHTLGRRKIVDDTQAKRLIADLLERYTPGNVLHLLAQVLRDQAQFLPHNPVA